MIRHVRVAAAVFVAAVLAGAGTARAHDLERTQVSLTFASDGAFVLDVANDPNWLRLRLEDFIGDYPAIPPAPALTSAPLSDADRDARLRALAPLFIDRVVLWVDHREIRATSAEYLAPRPRASTDDPTPLGVYRLRGRMPVNAATLQWYYGIVIDPYPLVIHRADARAQPMETVLGNAWSRPLDLSGQFHEWTRFEIARRYAALGYRLIVSRNAEPILFTLAIVLLGVGLGQAVTQLALFWGGAATACALAAYSLISLPSRIAIPLAALSVIVIALDNLLATVVTRRRMAALVVCGGLHGLLYAGAFTADGFPGTHALTGIATFDLGIAAGQMTVAALALILVISYRQRAWYHQRIVVPVSLAITVATCLSAL